MSLDGDLVRYQLRPFIWCLCAGQLSLSILVIVVRPYRHVLKLLAQRHNVFRYPTTAWVLELKTGHLVEPMNLSNLGITWMGIGILINHLTFNLGDQLRKNTPLCLISFATTQPISGSILLWTMFIRWPLSFGRFSH